MKIFERKPYAVLAIFGFCLWVLETTYFGFNKTAQSGAESMLDTISWLLIIWGILGDLAKALYVVKIDSPYQVGVKTELKVEGKSIIKSTN